MSTTATQVSGKCSLRAKAASPSRLPATDTVSYFPPFELMGSVCDGAEEGSSTGDSEREKERRCEEWQKHGKAGSLGSLAGLITWGWSSIRTLPKSNDRHYALASVIPYGVQTAEEAAEALTRSLSSRRRVLEMFTLDGGTPKVEQSLVCRKQAGSEIDKASKGIQAVKITQADELAVEVLVGGFSSRRPRPSLQVPLPPPVWRFPLPSPPVTSLSPDIPLEAFLREVDNPVLPLTAPAVMYRGSDEDQVEYALSPSVSPTVASGSQPSTPPRYRGRAMSCKNDFWTPMSRETGGRERDNMSMRRMSLGVRAQGKDIKPLWQDDEMTPKARPIRI
nr:hypothetical protein L204_01706 [Cryptococcus depauperatus CBS 7855]